MQFIGFLYSFLFAACYIPQAVSIFKNKSSKNVSVWTYWFCEMGYILAIIYTLSEIGFEKVLLTNYISGLFLCSMTIFMYYWYKPVDKK